MHHSGPGRGMPPLGRGRQTAGADRLLAPSPPADVRITRSSGDVGAAPLRRDLVGRSRGGRVRAVGRGTLGFPRLPSGEPGDLAPGGKAKSKRDHRPPGATRRRRRHARSWHSGYVPRSNSRRHRGRRPRNPVRHGVPPLPSQPPHDTSRAARADDETVRAGVRRRGAHARNARGLFGNAGRGEPVRGPTRPSPRDVQSAGAAASARGPSGRRSSPSGFRVARATYRNRGRRIPVAFESDGVADGPRAPRLTSPGRVDNRPCDARGRRSPLRSAGERASQPPSLRKAGRYAYQFPQ